MSYVIGLDPASPGRHDATVVARVRSGRVMMWVDVINGGNAHNQVTFAVVLPSFDEQVIAILADFGERSLWAKTLDTFRAMAKFGDAAWIEVAGHCHGLLYRADGAAVRETAVWERPPPESDWIIWRAHEDRFYRGDRGALLAGAGLPLDEEPT